MMFSSLFYRGDSIFGQNIRLQKQYAAFCHHIVLEHGKQVIVFLTEGKEYD